MPAPEATTTRPAAPVSRPATAVAPTPVPAPPKPSPEALAAARADFAKVETEVKAVVAATPSGPREIGYGQCPSCGARGKMFAVGEGNARKITYEGCICRKRPR